MGKIKKYMLNNKKSIPTKFSITYLLIGILSIVFFNKLLTEYFKYNSVSQEGLITFGVIFLITTAIILFIMLNHMQRAITKIDSSYKEFKDKDKDRLMPYEFALDNSNDAIYWFTLDGKFTYVNEAACKMIGRNKNEFLETMYLEDMDPNFTRQTAKECMHEIYNSENWRLETTQKRKDGTIFPVEVSGHGFNLDGKLYVCAFARDVSQKKEDRTKITKINEELQKSLEEKEILLKEIHHRVKNNMEIISSLLTMQYRRTEDSELQYILKQSKSRINTMALVHEFLYSGRNLAYVNIQDYAKRLIEDIKELYTSNKTNLKVDLNVEKLIFSTNKCIQVGMVIHELCVNALKYAFKENRNNLLCIHLNKTDDIIHIKIRDNGDGLEDIKFLYNSDSIGMQLVHSIVEDQLDGNLEFKNNSGLECNIFFSHKENKYD